MPKKTEDVLKGNNPPENKVEQTDVTGTGANDFSFPPLPPSADLGPSVPTGEGDNTQEEDNQVRGVSCNVQPSNRAKDVCKFFHSHLPSVKQLGLGGLVFQGAATFALGSSIVLGFVTLKAIGLAVLGAGIAASLGTGIGFMILGMAIAGIGAHYLTKNKSQPNKLENPENVTPPLAAVGASLQNTGDESEHPRGLGKT